MDDDREPLDAAERVPDADVGPHDGDIAANERELRRNSEAGVVTGVCTGLGEYSGIDPIVWRAAFALTALAGGTGIALYIAAWALMRDPRGGPAMAEQLLNRGIASRGVLTLLATGLAVATAFSLVGGFGWGTLVLATTLILGLLVAHNRGVELRASFRELPSLVTSASPPPAAPGPEPEPAYFNPAQPWAAASHGPVDLAVVAERAAGDDGNGGRNGSTAEGGGPGEGDGPGPGVGGQPVDAPRRAVRRDRRRARRGDRRRDRGVRLFHFAFWAVVIATGATFALAGEISVATLVGPQTGLVYLGTVVTIIGVTLVVGTWAGDPRGLVPLGVVATLLLVAAASMDVTGLRFGTDHWRPATAAEAGESRSLTAGRADVDLTALDLEPGQRVSVEVDVRFGDVTVLAPEGARVRVHARSLAGQVRVGDSAREGTPVDVRAPLPPEPSSPRERGDAEPPTLAVNLASYIGDMEVRRATP